MELLADKPFQLIRLESQALFLVESSPARGLRPGGTWYHGALVFFLEPIPRTTHLWIFAMQRGDALLRLIGHTPTIPIHFSDAQRTVWVKCEFLNPSGSIKDRLARTIVLDAEKRGLLSSDSILLECTSGNTGIAFAMVGAARGYKVAIVMSEKASGERRKIIQHFGAELILFSDQGYRRGIEMTRQMAADDPRYFLPRQFENRSTHGTTSMKTGVEMLEQMNQHIDAFVSGYGTGGTLAGCSKALKRQNPQTKVYAMEPAEAALLAGEEACCHWIEGIAGGFVPPLLQTSPSMEH